MSVLPIGMASSGGYQILNSLRFRASNSAYLSRTFGTPTNNKLWTFSAWVKRGALSSNMGLLACGTGSTASHAIYFGYSGSNQFRMLLNNGTAYDVYSTAEYRDPSAWLHIVVVFDSANATAALRERLYINGAEITALASSGYVAQNTASIINSAAIHSLGRNQYSASEYLDGYLSEVNFIDGQALTPSSFGETNSDGVWVPKRYTGTYGTNGFYLDFRDGTSATTLGYDAAGSNDWTASGISTTAGVDYDWLTDTPTQNACTLNPIYPSASGITRANLTSSTTAVRGTMNVNDTVGHYWEVTAGGSSVTAGVVDDTTNTNTTTVTANKVFGFRVTAAGALDYINVTDAGSWTSITTGLTGNRFPYGTTAAADWNFGQRPFVGTASGSKCNTANLPAVTITNPRKHFDVKPWAGDSSLQRDITGLDFDTDFTWIKQRGTVSRDHWLVDRVRGAQIGLVSNGTAAEATDATAVNAFITGGFRIGTGSAIWSGVNGSGHTFVSWNWKANGAGVTNTSGTITSTVSANTTAGFSICTLTASTSAFTFGHGLGAVPKLVIFKDRNLAVDWWVSHTALGTNSLRLNTTAAQIVGGYWGTHTTTVVSVNSPASFGMSASPHIAYCFAEIPSFSKAFSYSGLGATTDNVYVHLGFRPSMMLIKCSSTTGNWVMVDCVRQTYNVISTSLLANSANNEGTVGTANLIDFTASGFKVRASNVADISAAQTYVGFAWAQSPFGGSNISPAPAF